MKVNDPHKDFNELQWPRMLPGSTRELPAGTWELITCRFGMDFNDSQCFLEPCPNWQFGHGINCHEFEPMLMET